MGCVHMYLCVNMTVYVTEAEINELKVRNSKEQMSTTPKSQVTFKKNFPKPNRNSYVGNS